MGRIGRIWDTNKENKSSVKWESYPNQFGSTKNQQLASPCKYPMKTNIHMTVCDCPEVLKENRKLVPMMLQTARLNTVFLQSIYKRKQ